MVRADMLDCIDAFLRSARKRKKPFGGMRMVFIGDLYQLPPVLLTQEKPFFEQKYESPYFFSSTVMREASFELVELEKIYRQSDAAFIEVLNAIRKNCATDEQLAFINQRVIPFDDTEEKWIHLTATNKAADEINEKKLQKLSSELHTSAAEIDGEFEPSHAPTDTELKIKVGAQVMLLTNQPDGLWVNGTVGTVVEIQKKEILIQKEEGEQVFVEPHKWILYKYRLDEGTSRLAQDEVGSFTQYPLCLAWGITIHKSQGKTFDRSVVDLSRSFAPGQAYVALSRCRTFNGLFLKTAVKKEQIRTDHKVVKFLTNWQYVLAGKKCSLEERIKLIEQAIEEKRSLNMVYLKSNDEKSSRIIHPIFIGPMEFKSKQYTGMKAYCTKAKEERLFNVDRILELKF
jgi:ATP-dependent exoDNAse (exonuclease V) alpha subunit